ncbi:MAG: hypothetical protein ACOX12_01285 [Eggerthellaceae bacterium]
MALISKVAPLSESPESLTALNCISNVCSIVFGLSVDDDEAAALFSDVSFVWNDAVLCCSVELVGFSAKACTGKVIVDARANAKNAVASFFPIRFDFIFIGLSIPSPSLNADKASVPLAHERCLGKASECASRLGRASGKRGEMTRRNAI